MKNNKRKKIFQRICRLKYLLFFLIILILFIFFYYLPKSCKIDLKNYLSEFSIGGTCKIDVRLLILKEIKKNEIFSGTIKNTLRKIYFNSEFLNPSYNFIKIFNKDDIAYVENKNKEVINIKESIKGIVENESNLIVS